MNVRFNSLHEEAQNLIDKGQYQDAERILLDILSDSNRRYADVYNRLGFISHQKGEMNKAVDYFEKALSLNPRYTEASLNLAITFNEMGRYDDAHAVFAKAVHVIESEPTAIDPFVQGKLANKHAILGDEYHNLGLFDKAVKEYEKALELRPHFVDIITKMGITLREKGEVDKSIKVFMKAKEINSNYITIYLQLGISYYIKGFLDLALGEWESADKIDPSNKEVKLYLTIARKEIL